MFAALMLVAFTGPAGAFESKFEVVMLYDFVWLDADSNFMQQNLGFANDDDWEGFQSMINPFGYLGFVLKDENMGFTFNMEPRGHNDDDTVSQDQVKVRQMFYWWDVNDWFNLTVGQLASKHSRLGPSDVWAPSIAYPNTGATPSIGAGADTNSVVVWGLGFGQVFSQRIPQVQGNFRLHDYALFQIALVDPDRNNAGWGNTAIPISAPGAVTPNALNSDETTMPRVDLSLQIDYGPFQVTPSVLWVEHEFEWDQFSGNQNMEDSVTGWNLALPVLVSWQGLTFEVELNWGENWGNTNIFPHTLGMPGAPVVNGINRIASSKAVWDTDGQIKDTECMGIWTELKYNVGMFTPGIFYGYSKFENDELLNNAHDFENDRDMWVLWCAIAANKHLTITPYIKFADYGEIDFGDGATTGDVGDVSTYGVNFMVIF
jgi:hypothetical protein